MSGSIQPAASAPVAPPGPSPTPSVAVAPRADSADVLDADGGEFDWPWSDIDKPALRGWLADNKLLLVTGGGGSNSAIGGYSASEGGGVAERDEPTDEEYRQLLIAHVAHSAGHTADADGGLVPGQPPSPLSPDSAELTEVSSDDEAERDTLSTHPQQQQQQQHSAQPPAQQTQRRQAPAAAGGADAETELFSGHKRRRANGGQTKAPHSTSESDEERDDANGRQQESRAEQAEEDEWEAEDGQSVESASVHKQPVPHTPPPAHANGQPVSPSSSSSSVTAGGGKQRRGAAGPHILFEPPPFPLARLSADELEPSQLPVLDSAEGEGDSLSLSELPRPAPLASLFDSLYSVPAEVVYELRDESDTDSEDEAALAARIRLGCRFTALAGRRFAVPSDPTAFGWDWQASVALANKSAPVTLPLAAQHTANPSPTTATSPIPASSSSPSPSAASLPLSSSSLLPGASSSAPPPSLTFPVSVEPGVASHDGFDLPPVALPFVGFSSVSLEEADDERYRKRRRRDDDAKQHIPLAYRMRLSGGRDSHRGRAGSNAPPPAATRRASHSPSALVTPSLPSSPSSPSSSPALLSLLDPPMPNKRWRQLWAALIQQLPRPVRVGEYDADSAGASFAHSLSPHAAAAAELDDASDTAAPRSSSPSPSGPTPLLFASHTVNGSLPAHIPHAAGRDSPSLPANSSPSPPSSPRASASLSVYSSSTSARRLHSRVLAELCVLELRRRSARSLRLLRDTAHFSARLTRDMALYWRRHDREVVDMRRRLEREEAERQKREFERREAERQRKKLEFLLTQTELYSHFIGSKMGITAAAAAAASGGVATAQSHKSLAVAAAAAAGQSHSSTPSQMPSAGGAPQSTVELNRMERNERLAGMTEDAAQAARQFMESKQRQTAQFDADMSTQRAGGGAAGRDEVSLSLGAGDSLLNPSTMPEAASFQPCPQSFVGELKSYQLKGMNWLINLYDQGINGILADEMGLGKTIQSIAFLAFLSSVRQFWGPFLVVCPNSTLHQWQQEVSKFCPSLRVLPYWGSQADRALLRKYWTPASLGTADSAFHVLVTSYHTIVADAKYFNRLRWQYLLCLARGTPVSTQCGVCRPIEQCVDSGMALLSCQEPTAVTRSARLSGDCLKQGSVGSNDRGRRAVVRLRLEDGRHIDCTPDHRILTARRGWVEAAKLRSLQQPAATADTSGRRWAVDEVVCGPDGALDSEPSVGSEEWQRERSFSLSCPALQPFHMRSSAARQRTLSLARLLGYVRMEGHCCATTLTGHTTVQHAMDAQLVWDDVRLVCWPAPMPPLLPPAAVIRHPRAPHLLRLTLPSALVSSLLHLCGGTTWSACGRLSSLSRPPLPLPLPPFCASPSTPLSVVREALAAALTATAAACSLQPADATAGGSGECALPTEEEAVDSDVAVRHRSALIRASAAAGIRWTLTPVTVQRRAATGECSGPGSSVWLSQVCRVLRRLGVERAVPFEGMCGLCPPRAGCTCALSLSAASFHSLVSFRYCWSSQLRLSVAASHSRHCQFVAASSDSASGECADSPAALVDWLERTCALHLFTRRCALLPGESTLPAFRLRVRSVDCLPDRCDVFDLSVRANPSFLASGCVVHNCLAEGTLVSLANGTSLPIEQVGVGALVLSYQPEGGGEAEREGLAVRQVQAVLDQGCRECVELLFSDGRTLTCTPDHRIRTADGRWVEAQHLRVGEDDVAAGVECAHSSAGAVGESEATDSWQLDTRRGLGYALNMAERAQHSMAFARLLGYAMFGRHSNALSTLHADHSLDADCVARDLLLLTAAQPPTALASPSRPSIPLPPGLQSLFLRLAGAEAEKRRLDSILHLPGFVLDPRCPVPVVREFLGGVFGAGECRLARRWSGGGWQLCGLALWSGRSAAVAAQQQRALQSELLPLLQRCGVDCSSDVTPHFTAASRLDAGKAYAVGLDIGSVRVAPFARCVGLRYCCRMQQRLAAAAASYRAVQRCDQQRHQPCARIVQLRSACPSKSIAPAATRGKSELAQHQLLPSTVAWKPVQYAQLRHPAEATDRRAATKGRPHSRRSRSFVTALRAVGEHSSDSCRTQPAASVDDDGVEVAAPGSGQSWDEVGDEVEDALQRWHRSAHSLTRRSNRADELGANNEQEAEGEFDAAQPVSGQLDASIAQAARVLPLSRLRLVGRRAVGVRRVFDLSVASVSGSDGRSFVANGVLVHNCDEAQSLKNAASQRWKSLLNLRCRNRVLLTGTPIQNSMAELWALLHFIMPEFFDSHDEFNEWFSREIEDAAEEEQKQATGEGRHKAGGRAKSALSKRSTFQSRQLARLHLILRPFMLRRVKRDVENEMPPKVELLLDCPLSRRQRVYYRALTAKVRGAASSGGGGGGGLHTDKLMNLVMQFRKVVNHPQLMLHHRSLHSPLLFSTPHHFAAARVQGLSSSVVEVHDTASSPYASPLSFAWPARLLTLTSDPLRERWLHRELCVFAAHHIHRSLAGTDDASGTLLRSAFSFSRFVGLSSAELSFLCRAEPLLAWLVQHALDRRVDQLRAPLLSALLDQQLPHSERQTSRFAAPLLSGVESVRGRSTASLLLVRRVECALLSPRLPSAESVRARLRVRSSLSSCLTLTSRSGAEEQSSSAQLTIDEALTQADRLIDMAPFGLDRTRVHPNGEGALSAFGHHRQLLNTLSCCLLRVAAPPPFPYLPGTATASLRARLGYPGYCGWEESVLLGVDLVSHASATAALPLAAGERVPASFDLAHSVAPEAWQSAWHGLSALSALTPSSATAAQLSGASLPLACLPHTVVPGPLSASQYLSPPRWFASPTPLQLVFDSGKLQRLDALLSKLHGAGHRVLIFSQMTRMLDLLGEYLLFRRYRFARLDGQTSLADRRDLVRRFQTDPSIFAFILSTRAGGLGINLTAADTVIFFDNDWNPTQDAQAMDRSHRIGQSKPVTVYRMVCRHTVEERILNRAQVKFNIQKNVYAGGFKLQQHKEHEADGEAEDSVGRRQAAQAGQPLDESTAELGELDPASLFKSNELRELMLAEEDEQAWDTDYSHAAGAGRGRDRPLRGGDSYGDELAAEHDLDDGLEQQTQRNGGSSSQMVAAHTATAAAAAAAAAGVSADGAGSSKSQQRQDAQTSRQARAAAGKPPRQPTKAERAAAERAQRKVEKAVVRAAKEKDKREREAERRRKREAKQRDKVDRAGRRKAKAALKHGGGHSNGAQSHGSAQASDSGSGRQPKGSSKSRPSGGSAASGSRASHKRARPVSANGSDSSASSRRSSSSSSSSSASSSSSSSGSSSRSSSGSSSSSSHSADSSSGSEAEGRRDRNKAAKRKQSRAVSSAKATSGSLPTGQ